jgi:DNA-binding transcriptional MerR regulator
MTSDNPVYNIKVVLRETGIKADVLRAWERRYGLPKPQRSLGGHRLYSQHDIAVIKWLIARQNEGYSISSAVELWREIEADSRNPLVEFSGGKIASPLVLSAPDSNVAILGQQWLDACVAFNEPAAEQVLNQAFSLYPVETVVLEIIQQGMRNLGEMWFNGEISVQQEPRRQPVRSWC